jgi:transcriptional regulator with GAF, ATPase, and Fis domain
MPSLVLFPRPGVRTRLHNIYRRVTSIGAGTDNDIVIDDGEVAESHCQLFFDGKKYVVATLDRAAVVYVNGKKTRKQVLQDQDVIRLGNSTLQFSLFDIPTDEFTSQDVGIKDSLRKLLEFTTALMEQRELQVLIDLMLDKLIDLTGADKGFLFLVDGGIPTLHCARNIEREDLPVAQGGFSDSIVRQVVATQQPCLVSDALHDSEFRQSRSVVDLKLCSVMCVPVLARSDLVGVLYLGNDNIVNLFEEDSLEIVSVFASQAGLLIKNALSINELTLSKAALEQTLEEIRFGSIIGACQAMRDVFKRVEKVATTDIGVLIRGETGSGKELIARELHVRSNRQHGPFIAINCGAIPESLLESELFGHEKGAFTGAHAATDGKFQAANGGTLFLDEIGDMPITLQAKILRALETRQVTRVGGTRSENVDIRILAATNRNLEDAVAAHEFRQDLYYRLNVVSVWLPPLRERGDDVVLIANYLLQRTIKQYEAPVQGFSKDGLEALRTYQWPGNVRELENKLRKAVVLAEGPLLGPEDLGISSEQTRVLPLAEAKEQFQRDYVAQVLERNRGNRTQTARDLGVDPRTIFRYLEKERDDEGENSLHS